MLYLFGSLFFNNVISVSGFTGFCAFVGGGLAINKFDRGPIAKLVLIFVSCALAGSIIEIIQYLTMYNCSGNDFALWYKLPFYFSKSYLIVYIRFQIFKKQDKSSEVNYFDS